MSRHLPSQYSQAHSSRRKNGATTIDTGLSDSYTDQSYQDLYQRVGTDCSWSEDGGSVRIPPLYDYSDTDQASEPQFRRYYSTARHNQQSKRIVHQPRVFPIAEPTYHEISTQNNAHEVAANRRVNSSLASEETTSAIVDGCGGKCQTFENICYFLLQLVFMMGILIGVSLCIAGIVLRKSAARNLQVLVYIGILLTIVSGGLLGIQWNARTIAKRRKLAVRKAKRPIMMETLNRQSLVDGNRRVVVEEQGVPWWRREV